jgi:DNA recombination-dependent growth factor C
LLYGYVSSFFSGEFFPRNKINEVKDMGLLAGSMSFLRYAVEGDVPDNFWDFAAERITAFAFRDIDDTFEEYSIGWVSVENMFDSVFDYGSYRVGDYIILGLRTDERKISTPVLRKFTLKEEERIKKERQVPRLNRAHRQEIKENIRLQLMKKAVPMAAVYDLCWNLADGTLLFFSTNTKAQSVLEDFFRETFGLRLVLQIPYLTAEHLLTSEERLQLAELNPQIYV